MSRDICQVISQLKARWLDCYGDHLGTEEVRRTMSALLCDKQAEELRGVFSSWSAQELAEAIRVAGDIGDEDHTCIAMATVAPILETLEEPAAVSTKVVTRRRRTHAELAAAGHPKYK
jgi:hypothetical protein